MYMSNFVLGMLFARARHVRRRDVLLDGVLAGMSKNPAMGLVLVSALAPGQGKHRHGASSTATSTTTGTTAAPQAIVITSAKASVSHEQITSIAIGGQNLPTGPGGSAVAPLTTVNLQYSDGGVATATFTFTGAALAFGTNQITIDASTMKREARGIHAAHEGPE